MSIVMMIKISVLVEKNAIKYQCLLVNINNKKKFFFKAWTLVRRIAEKFFKYTNRSLQFYGYETTSSGLGNKIKNIFEELCQENKALEHWTQRKKRLNHYQQYVIFERSANQALEWIRGTGELHFAIYTNVGKNHLNNEKLPQQHNQFKGKKRKSKIIVTTGQQFNKKKGHAYATAIKQSIAGLSEL